MTKYFTAPLIGTGVGTDLLTEDPIRPDLPFHLSILCVGQPFTDNTYLVAVPDDSPVTAGQGRIPIPPQSLAAEAQRRGLAHADVLTWSVGPPSAPPGQGQVPAGGRARP